MKVLLFGGVLGNSSQVSDGAGAVLLMKRRIALEKNLPILGVFRWHFFLFFIPLFLSSIHIFLLLYRSFMESEGASS